MGLTTSPEIKGDRRHLYHLCQLVACYKVPWNCRAWDPGIPGTLESLGPWDGFELGPQKCQNLHAATATTGFRDLHSPRFLCDHVLQNLISWQNSMICRLKMDLKKEKNGKTCGRPGPIFARAAVPTCLQGSGSKRSHHTCASFWSSLVSLSPDIWVVKGSWKVVTVLFNYV